jgi:hypothetical protein
MDSRPLPTSVTEVLEQITEAAHSMMESLQQHQGVVSPPGQNAQETEQYILAALVVGMARVLADTNEIVRMLYAAANEKASPESEGRSLPNDDVVRKLLERSNIRFLG